MVYDIINCLYYNNKKQKQNKKRKTKNWNKNNKHKKQHTYKKFLYKLIKLFFLRSSSICLTLARLETYCYSWANEALQNKGNKSVLNENKIPSEEKRNISGSDAVLMSNEVCTDGTVSGYVTQEEGQQRSDDCYPFPHWKYYCMQKVVQAKWCNELSSLQNKVHKNLNWAK